MFSRQNLHSTFKHYFYGALLYGIGLAICLKSSYYSSYLSDIAKDVLTYLYVTYLAVMPFVFFFDKKKDIRFHKPALIFKTLVRIPFELVKYIAGLVTRRTDVVFPKINHQEKTAILFMLVKLFYIPLMLNFLVGNYRGLIASVNNYAGLSSLQAVTYSGYGYALSIIFFVDVLWFSFGYLFEAGFLRNKVRSVEPTLLGWAVALACYPPFNTMVTGHVGWSANDYVEFSSLNVTFVARLLIVVLMLVYLWATLSLGTKCSNLTNRGIVRKGAYKYVRHPAYVSKNLAWWITVLPVMSVSAFLTMFTWSFVYYLRAVTEERHLSMDPEYREYRKETKYMFVPYVW